MSVERDLRGTVVGVVRKADIEFDEFLDMVERALGRMSGDEAVH